MEDRLLTLDEAAQQVRLKNAATFSRFARRHGIPVIRFGNKVVRIRASDVEKAISAHCEAPSLPTERAEG